MTALQQIFQGYYENRIESDEPDPERMAVTYKKVIGVLNELQIGNGGIDDIMLWVSQYGAAAEETGFYAGFKMAWELLKICRRAQNKAKRGWLNKMSCP